MPRQLEDDSAETGSEFKTAGVDKTDVYTAGTKQQDDQAEGNNSKEGNTDRYQKRCLRPWKNSNQMGTQMKAR